jgi:hypothetical protein
MNDVKRRLRIQDIEQGGDDGFVLLGEPCGCGLAYPFPKYYWQRTRAGKVCHTIVLSHMECDACGSYITTPEQSQTNKRSIISMKDAFPTGLMATRSD